MPNVFFVYSYDSSSMEVVGREVISSDKYVHTGIIYGIGKYTYS